MGSIPLPALSVNPGPSAADQFGKVLQLKSMLQQQQTQQLQQQALGQENQQRQIQLNDTQAASQAMHEWDGKDINDLPGLISKHGGSANAVMGMRNQILQYQTAKQKLTTDQLTSEKQINDQIAGHLQTVLDAPEEKRAQLFSSAVQDLVQKGYADQSLQGATYQNQAQVESLQKLHMAKSAIDEAAYKAAQTREENSKAQAEQFQIVPELGLRVNKVTGESQPLAGGMMSPQMMEAKYVALASRKAAGQAIAPEDATFMKGYEKFKTLVPQFQINMATTGGGLGPGAGGGGGNGPAAPAANGATPQTPKKAAPGGWQSDNGHTLNDVPSAIRAEVQQVLEYRRADPSITQRGPVGQAINAWVAELDPQHDATTFGNRNAILRQYTKDANTGELGAINTSLCHLGDLYDASKGLSQQSLPILHNIASRVGAAVGSDAETTYMNILHKVGPELTKAYLASGGSVGERGSTEDDFGLNKGIKQIQSNIFESANLLNSKLASKRNDWEKNFLPYRDQDHFDARWVTPEARDMLQSLGSQSPIVKGNKGEGNGNAKAGPFSWNNMPKHTP